MNSAGWISEQQERERRGLLNLRERVYLALVRFRDEGMWSMNEATDAICQLLAQSRPLLSPDSPDIRGLLDASEAQAIEHALLGREWERDESIETWQLEESQKALTAARASVESAFSVLREEVERRFQEAMESHKANAELAQLLFDKDAEIEMLRENILSVRDRYSAELVRLQAEQLTPEEARYLLPLMDRTLDPVFVDQHLYDPLFAKLRSRSSDISGKEKE